MLKVCVGSVNPAKVAAVRGAFSCYFKELEISFRDVESGVSVQPNSAQETFFGAQTRARNAFGGCDYSVGIEGGLFEMPAGYMLGAVACIFDGKNFFFGTASFLMLPLDVVARVLAGEELGPLVDELTGLKNSKHKEGVVGIVTKGIVTRDKALEQAVVMALAPIVSSDFYGKHLKGKN